jgi:hypothetical protein
MNPALAYAIVVALLLEVIKMILMLPEWNSGILRLDMELVLLSWRLMAPSEPIY